MIYGIGTDIVEINRFEHITETFLKNTYTTDEILSFKSKPNSLAGNFAAKEAVSKALGTGFKGFSPKDIEILRSAFGAPTVTLYGGALALFNKLKLKSIQVSISHSRENACAFAIAEGED